MCQELGLFLLRHTQDEVHKAFRDQSSEIGGIRTTCGDPRLHQRSCYEVAEDSLYPSVN